MDLIENYEKILKYSQKFKDDRVLNILAKLFTWVAISLFAYYLIYVMAWEEVTKTTPTWPTNIFQQLNLLFNVITHSSNSWILLLYPIFSFGIWVATSDKIPTPKNNKCSLALIIFFRLCFLGLGIYVIYYLCSSQTWLALGALGFFMMATDAFSIALYGHSNPKSHKQLQLGERLVQLIIWAFTGFLSSLFLAVMIYAPAEHPTSLKKFVCQSIRLIHIMKTNGKTESGWLVKSADDYTTLYRKDSNGYYERLTVFKNSIESIAHLQRFEDDDEKAIAFRICNY